MRENHEFSFGYLILLKLSVQIDIPVMQLDNLLQAWSSQGGPKGEFKRMRLADPLPSVW